LLGWRGAGGGQKRGERGNPLAGKGIGKQGKEFYKYGQTVGGRGGGGQSSGLIFSKGGVQIRGGQEGLSQTKHRESMEWNQGLAVRREKRKSNDRRNSHAG